MTEKRTKNKGSIVEASAQISLLRTSGTELADEGRPWYAAILDEDEDQAKPNMPIALPGHREDSDRLLRK